MELHDPQLPFFWLIGDGDSQPQPVTTSIQTAITSRLDAMRTIAIITLELQVICFVWKCHSAAHSHLPLFKNKYHVLKCLFEMT